VKKRLFLFNRIALISHAIGLQSLPHLRYHRRRDDGSAFAVLLSTRSSQLARGSMICRSILNSYR